MQSVFVSSLAFSGLDLEEIVRVAIREHFAIEFSSGLPHSTTAVPAFLAFPLAKLAHNYFPAPQDPFVINLGSENQDIRQRSIDHCLQGLRLSNQAGAPFFAAHAGFSIDPLPQELGRPLRLPKVLPDMDACRQRFLTAVDFLLEEAEKEGVDFYIENNVVAAFNLVGGTQNPLLGCCAEELIEWKVLFHGRPFGLLLDTAHLKVSAASLQLDLLEECGALIEHIDAIHHSDNDGLIDNNQPIPITYWFKKYMPLVSHLPQVLEVRNLGVEEIRQQLERLRMFEEEKY